MFEIGDTLREARIRRGLSLKDVEDTLKIRSKYLQALEQDDFEVIPGPTFVKAFLRTYSDFLGLDTELMMEEYFSRYEPQFREQHQVLSRRTGQSRGGGRRRQPNYVVVGVVAVVIIVLLALVFRTRGQEPAVIDPSATSTSTSTTEVGDAGPDNTTGSSEGSTTTEAKPDSSTSSTQASAGDGAATVSADVSPAAVEAAADPEGTLDVVVTAIGSRCWLVIREESADGKTLFSGTLEKGQQLSYSSARQLYLNVGEPAAVRLLVDGRAVTVPEPYGAFVLSKAGLERL